MWDEIHQGERILQGLNVARCEHIALRPRDKMPVIDLERHSSQRSVTGITPSGGALVFRRVNVKPRIRLGQFCVVGVNRVRCRSVLYLRLLIPKFDKATIAILL